MGQRRLRTIIIGDIHGCNSALCALLEQVHPVPGQDRLVFLGDLFDRGPESREVFQTIQRLAVDFGDKFVLLRGNHEDYLLQPRLTFRQRMIWENVGRHATVKSFQRAGERMEETIPWLQQHVQLFWRTEELQCVHAGVKVDPLEANDLYTLLHDHDCALKNRYTGRLTVTGHIALENAVWFFGDGKTTEEIKDGEIRDLPEKGILCIDTGCGKGGRLTAMTIENGRFMLQSTPEKKAVSAYTI